MTVTEKAAYLKGLFAGLGISEEKSEGKLFLAIIDLLQDLSVSVQDIEDLTGEFGEELDNISEDLTALEDEVYGIEDECDCCHDADYEVTCPTCGEVIYVDDGVIDEGSIKCPACGEALEFDLSSLDDEDEDDKEEK